MKFRSAKNEILFSPHPGEEELQIRWTDFCLEDMEHTQMSPNALYGGYEAMDLWNGKVVGVGRCL